jgi:hypothetical protein
LGTTSAKSSKVIRPALWPLMEMSKKTRGLDMVEGRKEGKGEVRWSGKGSAGVQRGS